MSNSRITFGLINKVPKNKINDKLAQYDTYCRYSIDNWLKAHRKYWYTNRYSVFKFMEAMIYI